jgi:hypothetical protein
MALGEHRARFLDQQHILVVKSAPASAAASSSRSPTRTCSGTCARSSTRSLPLATRALDIVVSDLGNRAGVLGGAYLAIEHRLRPESLDHELDLRIGAGAVTAWAAAG